MREIKFRAWDGEKMKLAFDLSQNPKYWWEGNKDFPLMQYTGLKDKNGKETYERDIVKENDIISVCCWIEEVAAYAFVPIEVYPKDDWQTIFEWYGLDTFFRNDVPGIYVEVIGNIYENPELLEESK